tara:strand:- start:115 stop:666 length:552 start_codon:yes stop_codon:yes gene_type:complete
MNDSGITKVDREDHPNRCQAVNDKGQCWNFAVEGGTFCLCHGGNKQLEAIAAKGLKNYRIGVWQARLDKLVDNPNIKSLRDEVAILRMILEEVINKCMDSKDLILKSSIISDLVVKVEKLVSSCHKMEGSMGQLLDKSAILQFAAEIIQIIGDTVTDEKQMNIISEKILESVGRMGNRTHDGS